MDFLTSNTRSTTFLENIFLNLNSFYVLLVMRCCAWFYMKRVELHVLAKWYCKNVLKTKVLQLLNHKNFKWHETQSWISFYSSWGIWWCTILIRVSRTISTKIVYRENIGGKYRNIRLKTNSVAYSFIAAGNFIIYPYNSKSRFSLCYWFMWPSKIIEWNTLCFICTNSSIFINRFF